MVRLNLKGNEMTFKKMVAAAAIALASTGAVQAQGMYTGLGYSQVTLEDSGLSVKPTQMLIKLGYAFDKTWAVEGRLGAGGTSANLLDVADVKIENFAAIYAKGTLPLSEQFGLYGLLGFNKATGKATGKGAGRGLSSEESKDGSSYGVGAEFNVTKEIGLSAEWARHFSDTTSLTFAVNYKF